MSWLEQFEKCSHKYVLAWPVDYESARHESSSREQEKSTYGGPKFKVKISTYAGKDRLQEVQEVFKHFGGSDLANRLMNTGAQSQVSG